jgi:hypothetical protein
LKALRPHSRARPILPGSDQVWLTPPVANVKDQHLIARNSIINKISSFRHRDPSLLSPDRLPQFGKMLEVADTMLDRRQNAMHGRAIMLPKIGGDPVEIA